MRANLGRHAACDLRHGDQQGKSSLRARHRFIGDSRNARGDKLLGLARISGKVQVGEKDLAAFELLALLRKRLLDLDDQLRAIEHLVCAGYDLGAGSRVIIVTDPGTMAGASLNEDAVAFAHEFPHG